MMSDTVELLYSMLIWDLISKLFFFSNRLNWCLVYARVQTRAEQQRVDDLVYRLYSCTAHLDSKVWLTHEQLLLSKVPVT